MTSSNYPNYSVYIQAGGQLKHPFGKTRREAISNLQDARLAAVKVWNAYKGKYDVVILLYTKQYTATICEYINRDKNI